MSSWSDRPLPVASRGIPPAKRMSTAIGVVPTDLDGVPEVLGVPVAARIVVGVADIVLDAIEATHDRLGDLLAAQRPKVERSALFVRTTTPAAKSDEPNVQLYLRLSADNVGVIDQLVDTHKAPSRSALIAAALNAYLD